MENITYIDYFNSVDKSEVNYNLKYGKYSITDHLSIGGLFDNRTFGYVKNMQVIMSTTLSSDLFIRNCPAFIKETAKELDIEEKLIASYSIYKLYETFMFVHNEINRSSIIENDKVIREAGINELEKNGLSNEPTHNEIKAGLDDFKVFGSFIAIDKLAGGKLWEHDRVKAQPYSICFTKLRYDKLQSDYKKRYSEILNSENK